MGGEYEYKKLSLNKIEHMFQADYMMRKAESG
jgi:hypothetical protein